MKFRAVAACAVFLLAVLLVDFAVCRDTSVLAKLGLRATRVPEANPAPPPPARIEITPLPDPSVTVALRNVNGAEVGIFTILTDGRVDAATAPALKRFLRCQRTGREHEMATGLLAMLASVAHEWPGRIIDVVSAFRAPPFGVPHSKHFTGHAMDIRVDGVKTSKLRDFIWSKHREVGVGYYLEENFVHMDWRPGGPDIAWSSPHEGDPPEFNPRWAWTARHSGLASEDGRS